MEMNQLVINRLYEMQDEGHPHAIPVFGGAAFAFNCVNCDHPDFDKFFDYLNSALMRAKFWHYDDLDEVKRIFCDLCLIDPMLLKSL